MYTGAVNRRSLLLLNLHLTNAEIYLQRRSV